MPVARASAGTLPASRAAAIFACTLLLVGGPGCSSSRQQASDGYHERGLRLVPDPATTTAELAAVVEVPGADPARCKYTWQRGEAEIAVPNSSVLSPGQFRKGDFVSVEVTLPVDANGGPRTLRAHTRIANSPPVVRTVRLAADASRGGADLVASAECWDPDGDETTTRYRWYRNGKPIEGADGETLAALALAKGDRIEVEVTANDGESLSEPRRSEAFQLDNRAPQFAAEAPAMSSEDGELRVRTSASDPDGDAVRFELVQAPAGMTIDDQGAIRWLLPPRAARPGEVEVVVRASDPRGGVATQQFTVRLGTK